MHFIEYALLMGSGGGYPHCMGSGAKPVAKNRFRAFQRAKMSSQDTQLYTISYFFSSKIKLNTAKPVLRDHSKRRPKPGIQDRLLLT